MLILTTLTFVSLAMKGGSYIYYFENYVDKARLTDFISPILNFYPVLELISLEMTQYQQVLDCLMQEVLFL